MPVLPVIVLIHQLKVVKIMTHCHVLALKYDLNHHLQEQLKSGEVLAQL
jgi:hypothetical protein